RAAARRRACGRHDDGLSRAGPERGRRRHLHHADTQLARDRGLSLPRAGDRHGALPRRRAADPERARRPGKAAGLRNREMNGATARGDLAATLLLDASVIDNPYAFYRRLVAEAPVWHVPDTELVVVSSFDAVTEVVNRVEDFSSNLHAFLYRSTLGTPGLLPFEAGGLQALATAYPP